MPKSEYPTVQLQVSQIVTCSCSILTILATNAVFEQSSSALRHIYKPTWINSQCISFRKNKTITLIVILPCFCWVWLDHWLKIREKLLIAKLNILLFLSIMRSIWETVKNVRELEIDAQTMSNNYHRIVLAKCKICKCILHSITNMYLWNHCY